MFTVVNQQDQVMHPHMDNTRTLAVWIEHPGHGSDDFLSAAYEIMAEGLPATPVLPVDFAVRNIVRLKALLEQKNLPRIIPWIVIAPTQVGMEDALRNLAEVAGALPVFTMNGKAVVFVEVPAGGPASNDTAARVRVTMEKATGVPAAVGWVQWLSGHIGLPSGFDFAVDWPPHGRAPSDCNPSPHRPDYVEVALATGQRHNALSYPSVPSALWIESRNAARGANALPVTDFTKAGFYYAYDAAVRYVENRWPVTPPLVVLRTQFAPDATRERLRKAASELAGLLRVPRAASWSAPAPTAAFALPPDHGRKLAVVVHLYFPELWEEFERVLKRIPIPFDLFVSTSHRSKPALAYRVNAAFPGAVIFGVHNLGRDVAPFLRVLRIAGVDRYDYFLKLHGKKSTHLAESGRGSALGSGEQWRQSATDALIGDGEQARTIIEWLDDHPDVGIVAPQGLLFDQREWTCANGDILQRLSDRLANGRPIQGRFAAGTMFWARSTALRPFVEAPDSLLDFERETGQVDATLHHAYERAFALVADSLGFRAVDSSDVP